MALSLKNPQLARLTATTEGRTYTVAIVTVAVVVLLLFFAIRPSIASVFDRLSENEKKREYIDQMEQKQAHLVTLSNAETNQATQLQLLDLAFPESRNENEVLDNIKVLLSSRNIELKVLDVTVTDEKSNIETTLSPNTEHAIMTLNASGARSDIWGLVEDLENYNRIINIQKIGLSSRIDENGNTSRISDMEIVFEIYYYKAPNV